jgi:hypothetical protein
VDLGSVRASSPATTGTVSESPQPAGSPPAFLVSVTADPSGPPNVVVAVSTLAANGAASVTVTPISATDATVSLPDVPSPAAVDVLSTVQAGDLFFVPDVEDSVSINFNLHSLAETEPLFERMDVYSASGKMFSVAPLSPFATAETLTVPISNVPDPAAGLFVRIEPTVGFAPNTASPPWLFVPYYLLRITRNEPSWLSPYGPSPGGSAPGGQSPVSGSQTPSSTTPPIPLSLLERYLAANARPLEAENTDPVGAALGALAAPLSLSASTPTGPLPARSAAALGGVIATGDPVPQVDRRDAVAVDLELIGLPSGDPAVSVLPLSNAGVAVDSSVRLTTVRGPGGFPLLASTHERPVAGALAALPWATSPTHYEAKSESGNKISPLPTALPRNPEPPTRPPAGAGLTMALSLVIGPELPNLAAAFRRDGPSRARSHTRRR